MRNQVSPMSHPQHVRQYGAPRPRLCLATSYTSDYADIGSYCAMTLHLYAARWGYGVHVVTDVTLDRPPAWHRVRLIPELFDQGYEFVFWLDADALLQRFDVDILTEVRDGKDLYMVAHDHPSYAISQVPNTGVMLVRNTDWTRDLFDRLWGMTEYENHMWWENAAMIDLLGYRNLLGDHPFAPDAAMMARTRFLHDGWNHIPSISDVEMPIIRHYAGHSNEVRREKLPRDAAAAFRDTLTDVGAETADRLRERVLALQTDLDALKNSRSWRLTAPLRRMLGVIGQ